MALGLLGTHIILFGSICLDAFWIVFLGVSMDFIFLSTQGKSDSDGHFSPFFDIYFPFWVALHRHWVE